MILKALLPGRHGKEVREGPDKFIVRPKVAGHLMTSQDSVLDNPSVAIGALQAIVTPIDLKELRLKGKNSMGLNRWSLLSPEFGSEIVAIFALLSMHEL